MTKFLRELFTRIGEDRYGPRGSNPVYTVTAVDGSKYQVSRHKWYSFGSRWGWRAIPYLPDGKLDYSAKTFFSDNLEELAGMLGHYAP